MTLFYRFKIGISSGFCSRSRIALAGASLRCACHLSAAIGDCGFGRRRQMGPVPGVGWSQEPDQKQYGETGLSSEAVSL